MRLKRGSNAALLRKLISSKSKRSDNTNTIKFPEAKFFLNIDRLMMDDPDEFNNRAPCEKSSSNSDNQDLIYSPDLGMGMSDLPVVEEMNNRNKKMNVHVPVINTETLNCLAIDQEITFRDSMREDKKDTYQNKREKTYGD